MSDDFFAAHRSNLAAIEAALTALAGMQAEFEQGGSADEHWFYDLTCEVVHQNYLLHALIAALEGEKTVMRARLDGRLLAQHTIETVERIGGMLTRTLEKRVTALTDNPRIVEPLTEAAKEFAAFRRVNDKGIRSLRRQLGMEGGERSTVLQNLDPTAVASLALEVVRWLSAFGKATTLLISAIRADKAGRGGAPPPAPDA